MKSEKFTAADLVGMAELINAAHAAGAAHSAEARAHAAEAGRMLLAVEGGMRPRAFAAWVGAYCRFDPRMARWYMIAAEDEKQARARGDQPGRKAHDVSAGSADI